ncbi:membrane-bound metallopeptidase [Perkinsela sp. CCAP 1560/4]|nr:membrane-bound metallopeptidase [Perkinsela sp. CCAP 1560/4]|eukprot:KNH03629.1 membrane-bound metallopeptidase [Perkinsela sp. CCAP 1560/4]
MSSGSEPYNSRYSSRRPSSRYTTVPDDPRWQLTLKKEQRNSCDGLQRDVIKERLANVNAATLFSKNKIRLAMQDLYRLQRESRKRVEDEFEISLAEIGMYREKNRRFVGVLSGMIDKERKARHQILAHEAFLREWSIDQRVQLFHNEYAHRSSIERGFSVGVWELNTAEVAGRHALCISEGECRDRSTISALRDSEITEIYEEFRYVCEQCRYFTAATARLFDECTFTSSETIAEEHSEWNMLRNSCREAHESLVAFLRSRDKICRHEDTTRNGIGQECQTRYIDILRDFRHGKLRILEETKRAYESQAGLVRQEETDRGNLVITVESHEWSLLMRDFQISEKAICAFLEAAAVLMTEILQQAIDGKEHIFHASRNEMQLSIDELWEAYRIHQEIVANERALFETHLREKHNFSLGEESTRLDLIHMESANFTALMNTYAADGAALRRTLEGFRQTRLALFDEWHALVVQAIEAEQQDIYRLAQNYRQLTNCEIANRTERAELKNSQETSWNALMSIARNAKAALFVSSAVAELESFESYERNARTIAHSMSLAEMHSNFISGVYKIMLMELEAAETEWRGKIEEAFLAGCEELAESKPTSEPQYNPADMLIDSIEYQTAINLLRKDAGFQDAEIQALTVQQILGISQPIQKMRDVEYLAFHRCEQFDQGEGAIDLKIKAKRRVVKCLSEDVDDAKRAILKHEAAQKARRESVKRMRRQRKERNMMTKKRLDEVEKQVRLVIEECERTRENVRDSLRSSPLAKRGKPC